ncbi:MAG: phospholipase D-like domain-containing protein [Candidatus Xenobia bacterium]
MEAIGQKHAVHQAGTSTTREHREPATQQSESFSRGEAPDAATQLGRVARQRPATAEPQNPVAGPANPKPDYTAGPRQSPQFLGTEQQYFAEARRMLENAKPGDMVCLQMYEIQGGQTDPGVAGPNHAPGFQDQQALIPDLAAAAQRGVHVNVILDNSKDAKTGQPQNGPVQNYLKQVAKQTGNLTLDLYPEDTVQIDHAKELVYLKDNGQGGYTVNEALGGGSNWGNHTPANDDGGGAFYGPDAVGAADVFFRDQAFCRGDRSSPPNPAPTTGPVQWLTTSPTAEGGGSTGILDAKLALTQQANSVYINQFCLNQPQVVSELEAKGANAHVRMDPSEESVNEKAFSGIQSAGGTATWANTVLDEATMPGQKNHEKIDEYDNAQGQPFAATMGSANDTGSGLDTTHKGATGDEIKTNHEIDVKVQAVTDGDYSTVPFLQAMHEKNLNDLANRSTETLPRGLTGDRPGQF